MTFGFDSFQAYVSPTAAQADKTKQSQIDLSLNYAGACTSQSLTQHTTDGLDLIMASQGPSSLVSPRISFPKMLLIPYNLVPFTYLVVHQESSADIIPQQAQSRESITGSQWLQRDTYTKDDKVQSASVIYSSCGANGILNVNNHISLTSNSANGTGEL